MWKYVQTFAPHLFALCADFLRSPRVCVCSLFSCVRLFAASQTVTHQVPLSMGFPRQEYWSGAPFSDPEIKSAYFIRIALEAQAGLFTAVFSIFVACQEIS